MLKTFGPQQPKDAFDMLTQSPTVWTGPECNADFSTGKVVMDDFTGIGIGHHQSKPHRNRICPV